MSDSTASMLKENVDSVGDSKGKGKAPAEPETKEVSMDTEDSSSEEEVDEVCNRRVSSKTLRLLTSVAGCTSW